MSNEWVFPYCYCSTKSPYCSSTAMMFYSAPHLHLGSTAFPPNLSPPPPLRCPNGHAYVIGNCGGAMQRSRCPECGVTIGGGDHTLAQGNARADGMMEEMRNMAL